MNQDGSPHLSPMWIDVEDDYIVFNTAVGRDFVEGAEAERCMDQLAKSTSGPIVLEWRIPGEQRVEVLVEPARVRHVSESSLSGVEFCRRPET